MPPLDPRIILGVQPPQIAQDDPLGRFSKLMAIKQAQMQSEVAERGLSDEEAVRGAYRQAGNDPVALRALLQGGGQYKAVQALDKFGLEQSAQEANIGRDKAAASKSGFEERMLRLQHGASIWDTAKDQPSYDNALRVGVVTGVFDPKVLEHAPKEFNPQFIAAMKAGGLKAAEKLQAEQRAAELSQTTARDTAANTRAGVTAAEIERHNKRQEEINAARAARETEESKRPIVQTDAAGNVTLFDNKGNPVKKLGAVGKPTAEFMKQEAAKKKLTTDINTAISELEKATADGGLIDKSTGSGAGALVDMAAGFVGKATPGAIAVGQMAPIFDLVLKMVPRFEGPQSDKDTQSYKEAAGALANPKIPNPQKKTAAKEILRLMKARRGQFSSKDIVGTEADVGAAPSAVDAALEKYK